MSAGRILIVDDQPHAVRVIRLALTRQGFTVDTAGDGEDALGKLRQAHFDVVITDLDMPRMSGQALCEAIETELGDAKPLVLIVTGMTERDVRGWASKRPGTELLEKPLSLKRLVGRLEAHFAGSIVSDGSPA